MPQNIGAAALIAKLAPVFFLSVTKEGIKLNLYQIAHTLVVALIVSGITMYGTQRVMANQIENLSERFTEKILTHENMLNKVDSKIDDIAIRQAGVIAQANEIHKNQFDRLQALERRK